MRVGISLITAVGHKTGLAIHAQRLVTGLSRVDEDNEYVLFVNQAAPDLLPPLRPNFTVVGVHTPVKIHFWWEQIYTRWLIPRIKADVFHFPISAAPTLTRNNDVITVHDLTFCLFPETMTKPSRLYWDLFLRKSIHHAKHIIAVSRNTQRDIQTHFNIPADKVSVVYESVTEEFKPITDRSALEGIRYRYGLPSRFILFVGSIEPRKNLTRLLQALSILKKDGLPHKLVLVGQRGWGFAEVNAAISNLNLQEHLVVAGYVPAGDLPLLYSAADLFVYPSLYEGFGLPVLEAMSCGTPVVASTSASLPEVVGDAGLLVDPYNVDGLAEAMYLILNDADLRQALREKGLQRSRRFSLERMGRETARVYGTMAAEI